MLFPRTALAAFVVTASMVGIATGSAAATADTSTSDLAGVAAALVAEEQELLELAAPDRAQNATDLVAARARLRAVDMRSYQVFEQLLERGVELPENVVVTMGLLPPLVDGTPASPPPSDVYDAAVNDLVRIATADSAADRSAGTGTGNSFGLLIVAAIALLILGVTALSSALRRGRQDDLETLVWTDGLTGLANRRRLDHDLVERRSPRSELTAVIMVDVDHFKAVNDAYGHQAGDDVLCQVGTMLESNVRTGDVVYRYGGEEFCVLLHGASDHDAHRVADRIVTGARRIRLPDGSNLTVSVGVAEGTSREMTDTLGSADRALYAAKARGRDQSIAADDDLTPA